MASSAVKWTPPQRAGIETARSLLVSAAAGSGKTAVLAERCVYMVCDAPQPCDVDELLVVTFTTAAAAEMRSRIEQSLRRRLANQTDDDRLAKQLILLERAQINTLHGFCSTILRQHFHVLGLDPNFRVLDEDEMRLLRYDVARRVLDSHYEDDPSGAFARFIDGYGSDDAVIAIVLRFHDLLSSVRDPREWMREKSRAIEDAINAKRLRDSDLGRQLHELITARLADLRRRWIEFTTEIQDISSLAPYVDHAAELIAIIESWNESCASGFDRLANAVETSEKPTLPRIRGAGPEKEEAQAQINALKKEMFDGSLRDICRFTEQQWRDGLIAIAEPTRVLVELVDHFGMEFELAKQQLRGLDFSDLERFALRILCESNSRGASEVARTYHRRFAHVMVDEYQDINEVQDAILQFVSRESSEDSPANLFCVGDVKQSIYRFRLAEPRRFLERYARLKAGKDGGQVVDLSSNFRSRAPLIDVINAVFERLMTLDAADIEYDDSHRLVTGATFPKGENDCFNGAPVELHVLAAPPRGKGESSADDSDDDESNEFDRTEREAAFVAAKIREMIDGSADRKPMRVAEKSDEGEPKLRPIRYSDVVILLRSMRHKSEQFAAVLRGAGIAVHSDSSTGFFDSMEIRDMLALLRLLDNRRQDVPMAAVLRSPIASLLDPEDALAKIRLAFHEHDLVPFHEAAIQYQKKKNDALAKSLKLFFTQLDDWRRIARERPLAELIWDVYQQTGYLAFCAGLADGKQRVANLLDLHERAQQFGSFQRQGLGRFIECLDDLADQSDLGQPSIANQADDVVRIMSIHRAKGLEFPVVFVPDLGKKHNLSDTAGAVLIDREAGIGLMVADQEKQIRYPSLAHVLVRERIRRQSLAEELRVLYVAMTRAKEHLVLIGTSEKSPIESWETKWASHTGPMPAQRVLSANSMLDWLGPVAAMIAGSGAKCRIETIWHEQEEVADYAIKLNRRRELPAERKMFASLEPLSPPPDMNPQAEQIIARLITPYPHEAQTKIAAVETVSALALRERKDQTFDDGKFSHVSLHGPRCATGHSRVSALEIGEATHVVLEHLNFARAASGEQNIREQIDLLVAKKILTEVAAKSVDVESIQWLLATEVGTLLAQNQKMLRRELPIHYPIESADAPSIDPRDRVMIRGRIDAMIVQEKELTIIDFKTDRIETDAIDSRLAVYCSQLKQYRDAMQNITGRKTKACLVFFSSRQIRWI